MTFIEHPQTNGQVETANRVILKALCTRLDKYKGLWKEELPNIFWAYHCSLGREEEEGIVEGKTIGAEGNKIGEGGGKLVKALSSSHQHLAMTS